MKFKSIISTITLLCLLSLASCVYNKKTSLEAFKQDVYMPEYATGFKILGAKNAQSTLIQVSNPWQGAKDVTMSYFISRNGELPPQDSPDRLSLPEPNASYVCLLPTSPCSTHWDR